MPTNEQVVISVLHLASARLTHWQDFFMLPGWIYFYQSTRSNAQIGDPDVPAVPFPRVGTTRANVSAFVRVARMRSSIRLGTALLVLSVALAGCGGGGSSGPANVDVVLDFGAVADGTTDDEPAIQAALDYAAISGGGTVNLPAGVYGIARPLILRSNVHLLGAGRGKSVLRSTVKSLGKTVDGTGVWAAVAAVAADNVSIKDLTVDLSIAQTHANGVALLPLGSQFEGAVSTNCTISGIEVIGGGNYHAYMIWNLRGQHIRIIDNVIDGRIESPVESSYQEGIESYGGVDVLVEGNTVQNIGNTALNFGSAGLANTGIENLEVIENTVSNSGRALNLGPWIAENGPQNVSGVRIVGNMLRNLWKTGLHVSVEPGTQIRDVLISGNAIENVGTATAIGAVAIHFRGALPTASRPAGEAVDTVVSDNQIDKIRGANAIGLLVTFYPNVTFSGNSVSQVDDAGVQSIGSQDLMVTGNSIARTGRIGLISRGMGSVFVRDNVFDEWDTGGGRAAGVSVDDATAGDVLNNTFRSADPTGSAVRIEAGSANVTVLGNQLFAPSVLAEPFLNLGAMSNLGSFELEAGTKSATINNDLVDPTSTVSIGQSEGALATFTKIPEMGSIRVEFDVPLAESATFRYEIASCRSDLATVTYLALDC